MPMTRGQGNSNFSTSYIGPAGYAGSYGTYSTSMMFPTIGNAYPLPNANSQKTPITTASKISKGHITNANVAFIENQNYNAQFYLPN